MVRPLHAFVLIIRKENRIRHFTPGLGSELLPLSVFFWGGGNSANIDFSSPPPLLVIKIVKVLPNFATFPFFFLSYPFFGVTVLSPILHNPTGYPMIRLLRMKMEHISKIKLHIREGSQCKYAETFIHAFCKSFQLVPNVTSY